MADLFVNSNGSISVNKKKKKDADLIVTSDGKLVVNRVSQTGGNNAFGSSNISPTKTSTKKDNNTWFKAGAFDDGYQFGDAFKTILGTTGDVAVGVTKGVFNLAEGVVDLGRYGVAGAADFLGADEYAEDVKERAKQNTTNILFGGAEKFVDKGSVLGNKSDNITQGLGYVAGILATGGLGASAGLGTAGVTALTTGTTFTSATGGGMSQAYNEGATDKEALTYGLIAGTAEAATELLFGGLGKAVGAVGLSTGTGLDDALAKKVSSRISSQIGKNFAEYGIKAGAEGTEEVLSGIIQAIGQKVTYKDEEELGQLIKDQDLLEQFIAGAVTSGIAQSGYVPGMTQGSLKEANKAGRDFITGYTQNEQSIIDKEVENRIKELETDNKKLTNKEKAKIKEQVENDLQKGYISTDTIESTFGGEEYNTYKTTLDKKTSIENEIKELENKNFAELKVSEKERLDSLREELKAIDTNTLKSNLEGSMASKIANDGYLQRSYQEKANRSVKFEADVTKYDAKQQETIQKAIDSGILNNTNKTHEFVDMVAKISADKGVSFDFANNAKLKESGFAVDGKQVNGFVNENGITVNIDSSNALNKVVGHEITHVLEGTELYTELQQAVKEYATTKGEYDTRLANLTEVYKDVEGANVENELTSDLVGEYLFTDTDFVNNLSATKPNVFQKIYNEIKYLLKVATAGSKEARQLERVKKTFEEAYRNSKSNVTNDTQYSVSDKQKPSYMWHGTTKENLDSIKNNGFREDRRGYFATNHEVVRSNYGEDVIMLEQNDFNLKDITNEVMDFGMPTDAMRNQAKEEGYDGVKYQTSKNNEDVEVFNIKKLNEVFDKTELENFELSQALGYNLTPEEQQRYNKLKNKNTQYSLSEAPKQDNQGRELSLQQQEYFKDSKVRDENGNLEIVYHGSDFAGFTEFGPKNNEGNYKYGDDTITFYTNSKEIAKSYTKSNERVDTAKLNSIEDVQNWLETIGLDESVEIQAENGLYIIEDVDNEETISIYKTENELFRNFKRDIQNNLGDPNAGGMYEGYANITNPYIVDAKGQDWNFLEEYQDQNIIDAINKITPKQRKEIADLINTRPIDFAMQSVWDIVGNDIYNNLGRSHIIELAMDDFSDFRINDIATKFKDTNEIVQEVLESNKSGETNYDGVIFKNIRDIGQYGIDSSTAEQRQTVYVTFKSNQFKAADNTNPTSDADIRYSLSNQNEISPRQSNLTYGEDVALQISPLQEEIGKVVDEVQQMREQIDKMLSPTKEVEPEHKATTYEDLEAIEQQYAENTDYDETNIITKDSDNFFLPNEVDAVENEKQVKDVIRNTLGLNTKQTSDVYKSIVAIEDFDIDDVKNAIEEYSQFITNDTDTNLQDLKKALRTTKLDISYLKATDANFKDYVKNAFGSMRLANSGQAIDSFYNEMSSMYPDLLPSNIDNEADQFQRLLEVSKMDHVTKYTEAIPEETMNEYANGIYKTIKNYQDNLAIQNSNKDFFNAVRKGEIIAPVEIQEEVETTPLSGKEVKVDPKLAPTTMEAIERSQATIKNEPSKVEQQIAQILDEKPTKKFDNKRMKAVTVANIVDKGYYISKLARKTNNRQLDALWDNTLLSNAQAQEIVGEGRFKLNEDTRTYEKVGESVYEIFEGLENTNKVKDFNKYMYHKLNVERMSLEDEASAKMKTLKETTLNTYTNEEINKMARMQLREDADQSIKDLVEAAKEYRSLSKVKNKPVFGYDVDANASIGIVTELEQNNPEFSDYAKKVYEYESGTYGDLAVLVDSGILSQEDANYYKNKYESYVPIMRDMDATMVEGQIFGKRASVGNAVKSATGGSQDIIPLKDAMAIKTMLVQRSANMNKLGLELMYTLNPVTETETMSAEKIIEDISNNKDLIQAGTNGKAPTMTVYEHGVKHTFEIPIEIYEALKANYDSYSKMTIKPLNAFSNFKRNVLTQYNPFFMVTNAIKDSQDILINSQHPVSTYKSIPEAIAQLTTKGYWYKEMQAQGLFQDTYYDNQQGFDITKKGLSKITEFYPLRKISEINDFIERVPRMAEYIASRKAGASVEVASLDASRVTTNFKAGGDWTKFFNRNGATFLNASVQGALQQVRNVQEAHQKGLKGYAALATKFAVAALPAVLLNALLWDDDEEYEELSDYIKDNYYIIGKYGDGQFIRIPKGRMTAVIQKSVEQMQNMITGDDEVDLGSYLELVVNNIAPSNPVENNIFSPFINTKLFNKDDAGKTWYGGDLVPTRLQSKPVAEQYDETTDELSKWLGEKLNLSPVKINNLIDQNTGVIGDMILPMMTAEAKTKNDNPIIAGIEDKFTADVVFDNKYSTDFYSVKEDLTKASNGYDATDEDVLKTKYMNSRQSEMNDIYAEIRDVQNSDLDKESKYAKVRDLRKQLNEIAEEALSSYEDTEIMEKYATVGGKEYYKNTKNEWTAIKGDEAEALNNMGMSSTDKENYFEAKNTISNIVKDYKGTKEGLSDENEDEYESEVASLSSEKKTNIINTIRHSGLNDEQKAYLYDKYYASPEKLNVVISTGIGMDNYLDVEAQNFTADKNAKGETISGSKKKKIFNYINSTNLGFEQRVILAKMYYPSYDEYNYDVINYLNNDNSIDYNGMVDILKTLGFEVKDNGVVSWK